MSATSAMAAPPRFALAFIMITILMDMIGFGIIIPVLPKLIETVGNVSLAEAAIIGGWMAAAYSIAQFLCGPLLGNLSDRYGRRPLLLIAIFGLGADFLAQALAPNLGWLFFGRILAGICGASWVIASAFIADITPPEDRGRTFGYMGAAFGLGFIIGPALGGLLGEFGPRVPFYAAAAVSVCNFVFGIFVLPETLDDAHRRPFDWRRANPLGAFRVFRQYHGVLPMCLILALMFFFTSVYASLWPFWAKARFGWSEWMIGATLAIFGLVAGGFQAGVLGPFSKRFGEKRSVAVGLLCAAIAATGYGIVWSVPMVIALMIVHGPEGFVHPMLTALMSKRVPENAQGELQGGLSAIMNVTMLVGTVFYAQVFGFFLSDRAPIQSPNVVFLIAGAGMFLTFGLFLWLIGHDRDGPA